MFSQSDFDNWIGQKYAIQKENADTERMKGEAQAYATTQQGATFGPLADASIAHTTQGQIPLLQAQAAATRAEDMPAPAIDRFPLYQNMYRGMGNPNLPAGGGFLDQVQRSQQNLRAPVQVVPGYARGTSNVQPKSSQTPRRDSNQPAGPHPMAGVVADALRTLQAESGPKIVNAKAGMTKVPGKGPPNVDSVPAKLAPQEAVLNAGAAQHLGRGAIAMLNALGARSMAAKGMPPQSPQPKLARGAKAKPAVAARGK